MPIFDIKIWVSESRYYTIEAEDADEAYEKAEWSSPNFVKNHDKECEIIEERQG
jgi:hypothetical protein